MLFLHQIAPPRHGGNLQPLIAQYQIPRDQWLDLSSAVNPAAYPVVDVPSHLWHQLPEPSSALLKAAQQYYGCEDVLLVPGSQWAIAEIPSFVRGLVEGECGSVLLPALGYQEHAYAWLQAGFKGQFYRSLPDEGALEDVDVCVVINPNNPSGELHSRAQMLELIQAARRAGTLLIVDEAFIDMTPEHSVANECASGGVIVLRSLGKFFGLAGARLGCVCAWPELIQGLQWVLPAWSVNSPAQFIAEQALSDQAWIDESRDYVKTLGQELERLLKRYFSRPIKGTALFQTVFLSEAPALHSALCQKGIATRMLDDESGVRFGLPPESEEAWTRLESALADLAPNLLKAAS